MKAVVLRRPKSCSVETIDTPVIKDDEVLIRVKTSGICTNDIRDFNGDCNYSYPRIGGHEYCGVIEEMGKYVDSSRFQTGQKVVAYIIENCGQCYYCKRGEENICESHPHSRIFHNDNGLSGYGGFAEFITAKASTLFVYPDDTSFEKMAYTEPLACVVNSINCTDIKLGDDVLIIGAGPMGLLHLMVARLKGARVIISEPQLERRQRAMEMGTSFAIDPIDSDALAAVKELTGGCGAEVVFNTNANPKVAEQAVEMTAPGGTCVLFSSLHPNDPMAVNGGVIHSYQKTVTGAVSPTIISYGQSVSLIAKGLVDPTVLTEGIFDYTDFDKAMEKAQCADSYKVIIKFGDIQ